MADWLQRRAGDDRAAGKADTDNHERDDRQHRAISREQRFAILAALADLEQRAVRQPRRGDLEPRRARFGQDFLELTQPAQSTDIEVVPGIGGTEEQRLGRAAHHAHEHAFPPARPLLDLDSVGKRAKTTVRVSLRVLAQRGDHELLIALLERGGQQPISEQARSPAR